MATKTKAKFLRIPSGKHEGMYQIKPWKGDIDMEKQPFCPCCGLNLEPAFDICQWGMFDDKYTTFIVCKPCAFAFKIEYSIATYALVSKQQQKATGVLLSTSKKSRTE